MSLDAALGEPLSLCASTDFSEVTSAPYSSLIVSSYASARIIVVRLWLTIAHGSGLTSVSCLGLVSLRWTSEIKFPSIFCRRPRSTLFTLCSPSALRSRISALIRTAGYDESCRVEHQTGTASCEYERHKLWFYRFRHQRETPGCNYSPSVIHREEKLSLTNNLVL